MAAPPAGVGGASGSTGGIGGGKRPIARKQWSEEERLVVLDTVRRVGTVDGAVRWLHIHCPATFSKLNESTVRGWFRAPRPLVGASEVIDLSGTENAAGISDPPSSNGSGVCLHIVCCAIHII